MTRPLTAKNINAYIRMCKNFVSETFLNDYVKMVEDYMYNDKGCSLFNCTLLDVRNGRKRQWFFYINGDDIRNAEEFEFIWEAMFDHQDENWFYLSLKEAGESVLKAV